MGKKENPDLCVAKEAWRGGNLNQPAAKTAFLPKLTIDTDYGIEANAFALHSVAAAFAGDAGPRGSVLPNLGYFVTAALNIPVWDWGTLRSKLHQARYKQDQAKVQLTQT